MRRDVVGILEVTVPSNLQTYPFTYDVRNDSSARSAKSTPKLNFDSFHSLAATRGKWVCLRGHPTSPRL